MSLAECSAHPLCSNLTPLEETPEDILPTESAEKESKKGEKCGENKLPEDTEPMVCNESIGMSLIFYKITLLIIV